MRNYASLSPSDFERLVRDLLQAEWGERLETFPEGPDGGVDVRLVSGEKLVRVQCKHSPEGGWSAIKGSLKREARIRTSEQLGELWLVTSARMTAHAKDEASRILAAQGLVPERVLGRDDVENLLNRHPEVEQRHVHLHTTSAPFLQSTLHQGLTTRRQMLEATIAKHAAGLARIGAVDDALAVLTSLGYCVITGPPGIGKTALAQLLLEDLRAQRYALYDIAALDEIGAVWRAGEPQVFLGDDFLGELAIETRLEHRQALLLGPILDALPDGKHLLVFTTRAHIMAAALQESRTLAASRLVKGVVALEPERVSRIDRARILSTQMRTAGLTPAAFESLRRAERHLTAVWHQEYNPRVTQQVIEATIAHGLPQDEFADRLLAGFADPRPLWSYVFWQELNETERLALLALASLRCGRPEAVIETARTLHRHLTRGRYLPYRAMEESLTALNRMLVKIESRQAESVAVTFANPGMREFVLGEIAADHELFAAIAAHQIPNGDLAELLSWVSPDEFARPRCFQRLESGDVGRRQASIVAAVASIVGADRAEPRHPHRSWENDEHTASDLIRLFAVQGADPTDLACESVSRISERWQRNPSDQGDPDAVIRLIETAWPYLDAATRIKAAKHSEELFRVAEHEDHAVEDGDCFVLAGREGILRLGWLQATQRAEAAERLRNRLFGHLTSDLESLTASDWEFTYGTESLRDADSDYQHFNWMSADLGTNERFQEVWGQYYAKWKRYKQIWTERNEREQAAKKEKHTRKPRRQQLRPDEIERAEIHRLFE